MKQTLTLDDLIRIVGDFDFILWATGATNVFSDNLGISITIYNDDTEKFIFRYKPRGDVFYYTSDEFSPASNEDHFRQTYYKFRRSVIDLFGRKEW